MKIKISLIIFVFIVLLSNISFADCITVEAEGSGETKAEALNNAWSEAVRKAVGIYLNSRSTAINDELLEQIVSYSRGCVDAYKVLKEEEDDDEWNITIKANVDKEALSEIKTFGKKIIYKSNKVAKIASGHKKTVDAMSLIDSFVPFEDISEYINYKTSYKIKDRYSKKYLYVVHLLTINDNYKKIFLPEMDKLLTELSTNKSKGRSSNNFDYNYYDYIDFVNDIKNIPDYNGYETDFENKAYCGYCKSDRHEGLKPIGKRSIKGIDYYGFFRAMTFKEIETPKVSLFLDDLHFYKYQIKDEDVLKKLKEKFTSKKYKIKFVSEVKYGDDEKDLFETSFSDIGFFYLTDTFTVRETNGYKIKDCIGHIFFPGFNKYDPNDRFKHGLSSGSPVYYFIQGINISPEQASKIKSVSGSYEIQEK
jgi:hypothetical protein